MIPQGVCAAKAERQPFILTRWKPRVQIFLNRFFFQVLFDNGYVLLLWDISQIPDKTRPIHIQCEGSNYGQDIRIFVDRILEACTSYFEALGDSKQKMISLSPVPANQVLLLISTYGPPPNDVMPVNCHWLSVLSGPLQFKGPPRSPEHL